MRRALFLDRDGVINVDRDYVYRIEDFEWQDGIFDLVGVAAVRDLAIVVVTNQSGIARGYYTEQNFFDLSAHMCTAFAERGTPITRVYHCPYHPRARVAAYQADDHPWRKPRPGMLLAARDDLGIDLSQSILVGDRWKDIEAGHAAGLNTLVLIGDGRDPTPAVTPPHVAMASVADAARWLANELDHSK